MSGTSQLAGEYLHSATRVRWSPHGGRVATATCDNSVHVYDSSDGRLLIAIKANVNLYLHASFLWFNNYLLVISDGKIKQIDASTGSAVSEWKVYDSDYGCISLPTHGEFVAYSTERTVTFWDTSTHTEIGRIQHTRGIHSIALSPDDRSLAVVGDDGKFTIENRPDILFSPYSTVRIVHGRIISHGTDWFVS